jgi:NhaP-type Na+/H+ or K+/H+ antiporter
VLGTLIVQGMTLGPLIRLLQLKPDESLNKEISSARLTLLDAAVASLGDPDSGPAKRIRADYDAERLVTTDVTDPQAATHGDELRIHTIQAQRRKLADLRNTGEIDDDVYYALEEQLDWAELAALPPERSEMIEG